MNFIFNKKLRFSTHFFVKNQRLKLSVIFTQHKYGSSFQEQIQWFAESVTALKYKTSISSTKFVDVNYILLKEIFIYLAQNLSGF